MSYAANTATEDTLGSVLWRCRREAMVGLGFLGEYYFWAGPILCGILAMFLTFPLVGIAAANKVPPPLLKHPFWGPLIGVWWFAWFVAIIWYMYILPRGDSLVLYEKGFRCRIGHRRWQILLSDLREIRLGQKRKESHSLLSALLLLKPRYRYVRDFIEKAKGATMTLTYDGSQRSQIPTLLVRFAAEDLKEFFRLLVDRYPHLSADDV